MKKLLCLCLCFFYILSSAQYANGKIKVYFSRPVDNSVQTNYPAVFLNGTWADTLCAYINRAKYSIDVAQYNYSSSSTVSNIAAAVNAAYARGVVVRWIYNGSSYNSALTSLSSGIKKLASPTSSAYGIMHHKFVVFDANSADPSDAYVWTGSPDWSKEMVDSDANNIIIFQDQPLAAAYTAQFNQMWGGTGASPTTANEKFGPYKADLGPHTFTIGGSTVELYFSPTDSVNNRILSAINSANSQLFFGVYTFTQTNDANAIVARKNAGVQTAGVIDQYSDTYSEYPILTSGLSNMIKVYAQSTSLYHTKFLIADPCNTSSDPLVLTGSHNWTTSADTKNDENTVIVHNADVANIYYQAFFKDFNSLGGTQLTSCVSTNPCLNAISASTAVVNNVTCHGQSNGSGVVHASGTHTPFTYKWSSSPTQTDSVLSNVAAGTYIVTITNTTSCTATATVTIADGSNVGVSITETNVLCNGQHTGTATATPAGGTTPYTYTWSTAPAQQSITATGLAAGTYTVSVTDHNGCSTIGTAIVTQPSVITISGNITNVTCFNGNTGSIAASATGGAGSFHYLWSTLPQQSTATISNLTAGSYVVTVTDANNCTVSKNFNVTQPATGLAVTTNSSNASCGSSNGLVTTNVTGGTGTITYHWSNGATTSSVTSVAAGSYAVTVSETGGCTATASALVNSTGGPSITVTSSNTTCGNNNGSVTVSASGGSSPYTYSWSNGATTSSVSNLAAGSFTVTVHDNNGCISVGNTSVGASGGPVLNITSAAATCGLNNGSATVSVSNATSPSYVWSNNATTSAISNLNSGSYTVTVTDVTSCTASASVTVTNGTDGTQLNVTSDKNTMCQGDSAHICANQAFNTYLWSNNQSTACIYAYQTGQYVVTAVDNNGCSSISSPVVITVNAAPVVSFGTYADTLIATAATTYQWLLNGTPITNATNEVYVVTQPGNYAVQVSDANGCQATSNSRYITITGIDNLTGDDDFIKVYPNPMYGPDIYLEVSPAWIGSMCYVYDITGKPVQQAEVKDDKTELQVNVPAGIYVVKIFGHGRSMVKKLVKL